VVFEAGERSAPAWLVLERTLPWRGGRHEMLKNSFAAMRAPQ
jgi:hypothetical protein